MLKKIDIVIILIAITYLNIHSSDKGNEAHYWKAFVINKVPSSIEQGPKSRDTLEVHQNVCMYEARYQNDGVTITGNKRDLNKEWITNKQKIVEKNETKKEGSTVISIYRCFISKENENIQEVTDPLVSEFIYSFLQEKYEKKYKEVYEKESDFPWGSLP